MINTTEARQWALWNHAEQKYADQPYEFHLRGVVDILDSFGYKDDLWYAVGWLHDVVEDTVASVEEVVSKFGIEVGMIVWAVTGEGKNRVQKQQAITDKLRRVPEACILKICDTIFNVENSVRTENASKFNMYYNEKIARQKLYEVNVPWQIKERYDFAFASGREKGLLID